MFPYLEKSIKQLINAGTDFIVIPCNTLHALLPKLRRKFNIRFIDLIEETSKMIKNKYQKVGILASKRTRHERLYDRKLSDIEFIYPFEDEQERLSRTILRIISGKHDQEDKKFLDELIKNLQKRGAEKIVLACTDLGNIIKDNNLVIDSTKVLIERIKDNY